MNYVVIGAGFGDEGKGLMTDALVRKTAASTVVRFNGGAQAGHTVVADGEEHVFHHVGAGTFAGAQTHLGQKFIINPILLGEELGVLAGKGVQPKIKAHYDAKISTIYDMVINAMAEEARGNNRHGSCGLGINETVTRGQRFSNMTLEDLFGPYSKVQQQVRDIRNTWVPVRIAELGIPPHIVEKFSEVLNMSTDDVARDLYKNTRCIEINPSVSKASDKMVFEGAQGLALDEFLGEFPHVTRSLTGLPYAILDAGVLGVEEITPVYVTRAYATRHGAGPLLHDGEAITKDGRTFTDKTNVENEWQGQIRFAPLDLMHLRRLITSDYHRGVIVGQAVGVKVGFPMLAVTCLDQVQGTLLHVYDGSKKLSIKPTEVTDLIATSVMGKEVIGLQPLAESHGRSYADVRFLI